MTSELFPEVVEQQRAKSPSVLGDARWKVLNVDSQELSAFVEPMSVDAWVTDPPAGISFMGKEWDGDKGGRQQWIHWLTRIAQQAFAAMKPGAWGLVWALPRTQHWTMTALEDAGFEIRDVKAHLFGTGMPKATDKAEIPEEWKGWNTALKPAHESWVLIRKPMASTLAANLGAYGTGAMNIDGARLGGDTRQERNTRSFGEGWGFKAQAVCGSELGRWPANVMLSPEAAVELDAVAGERGASAPVKGTEPSAAVEADAVFSPRARVAGAFHDDAGGPSRFFPVLAPDDPESPSFLYCSKPSPAEKQAGCEGLEVKQQDESRDADAPGANNPRNRGGRARANHHPTPKAVELMRWLVRLVTPPNGVVLDTFAGSGSTGVACVHEGFRFLGLEIDADFTKIAQARIAHATQVVDPPKTHR